MSLDTPQSAALPGPDPLADFRRQAAAIVAQERGLSPASRVKLLGIARQLGISDEQVDAAIRSLGESAAPPVQENPNVERFRRRLRKDLAGKERAIIGPSVEAQIVANAARKYGLDQGSIMRVLGEVAAELGLARITASDAIATLCQQIEQATGESTWLAKEAWDRLRIAGARWGIELETVDELIDERLAANKTRLYKQRRATRATLVGAGGAIGLVAVGLVVAALVRSDQKDEVPSGPAEVEPPAAAKTVTKATWHDTDLSLAIAKGRTKFKDLGPAIDLLSSAEASDRTIGYRKLAEAAQSSPPQAEYRQVLADLLAGSFALEPDDAAAGEILTSAFALVPSVEDPLPRQRGEYEAAYWVGDFVARASLRTSKARSVSEGKSEARSVSEGPADRRLQLASAAERELGVSFAESSSPAEVKLALWQKITARHFEQLTAAASKQPTDVAVLHELLVALQPDLADREFLRLEANFLAAALPAAGTDWKGYEEALYRTLAQPDPLRTLKLLEAYQRVTDPALKRELADLLIVATSAKPKSLEPADVVRAVRLAVGGASAGASTAQDRWLALQLEVESALARPAPPTGDQIGHMTQIVELAHLTTLAMALAQGDAGFATFDALLDKPPQLAEEPAAELADFPPPRRTFAPLAAKDRTELARLIDQVAGHARLEQVQRESNFRALADWAEKTGDILPSQAIQIAYYILAPKPADEQASLVSKLPDLRRWKRLRLAVADMFEASKLSPDERQQVAARLLRGGIPPESTAAADLRQALVDDVLGDLEPSETAKAAPAGGDKRLDRIADQLADTYRTRARLFSVGPAEAGAAQSPSQALVLSIAPLASSLGSVASGDDSRYLSQLSHQSFALDSLAAGHDPRRTAAASRVFLELSARRLARLRPTQASEAKRLLEEASASELAAAHVLAQVRQQELAALKIWMLYAPQT